MRSARFTRRIRCPYRPFLERCEERVVLSFDAPRAFDAGSSPYSVAMADYNGDGVLDLAVANYGTTGRVSVLLGTGDGTFGAARSFSAGNFAISLAVGDFDGDGVLDLVVANSVSI